jgi:integrase
MLTRLKVFCKWAGVKPFCFHDLRRSCITNWARHLPIHAVQELAGHSKIETTRKSVHWLNFTSSRIIIAGKSVHVDMCGRFLSHRRESEKYSKLSIAA